MAEYRIHLLRDDFTKLAVYTNFVSIRTVQTANAVGSFDIVFPKSFNKQWLAPDRIIEIYRSGPDVPEYRHFSGLLRKWYWGSASDGTETLNLVGTDWNDLLKRRVVAYAKGTAGADKSGHIDNVIKAYVRENLGASAGAGRSLASCGLVVQSDTSKGSTVTASHEYTNLLQAIQDVSDDATDLSEQVFFWIEHVGKNIVEFRTNVGFMGQNRTQTSSPLYFGEDLGNLINPRTSYDYTDEVNFVYVSGRGEGEERVIETVSEDDWIAASRWNRRESYTSKADSQTSSELSSAGQSKLAEGAPTRRVTGEIKDIKLTRLGRDWNFGDQVWYQHAGGTFPVIIASLDVTVDDTQEIVRAALDTQANKNHWDNPAVNTLYVIKSLRKEVLPVRGQSMAGLTLDFTTDLWDTVAECNKLGIKFSDVNSPFPTILRAYDVAGTWENIDGRGWQPFCSVDEDGPAILIPLASTGDWELLLDLDFTHAAVAGKSYTEVGYLDASGQVGAHCEYRDNDGSNVDYQAYLYTHDGDGTYTNRYLGSVDVGATVKTVGIRVMSSTISIYDNEDLAWHEYEAPSAPAASGWGTSAAYIQFLKVTGSTLDEVYVRSLKMRYLSRSG